MNETENVELVEESASTVSGNNGVSLVDDIPSGLLPVDVSTGDSGDTEQSTDSGYDENISSSESDTGVVSGDNYSVSDTVCEITVDYTENLKTIETELKGINALLVLVFVFLLLEWTEKKLTVIVKRFGERRRR